MLNNPFRYIIKHLLADRRHSFTEEKLENHLIVNLNIKE